jgi:hypothetical protein
VRDPEAEAQVEAFFLRMGLTQLYDRRSDDVTLDEVERISFKTHR